MSAFIIYVSCRDREEAERIAGRLLDLRLIACANIMPPHLAVYSWRGKQERADETAMLLKTQSGYFDRIRDEILRLHSYDCPAIAGWPIEKGHEPYLQWISAETKSAGGL